MLILTRKVGESVIIGKDVTITVLRVKGNQVRLGVNAPKEISVQRDEILQRGATAGAVADTETEATELD